MNRAVNISRFCLSCLSRERADEVFGNLRSLLKEGAVDLELDAGATSIGTSFLDELVTRLATEKLLDHITFVTPDHRTIGKLARVSRLRNARLFYRVDDHSVRMAVPLLADRSHETKLFLPVE